MRPLPPETHRAAWIGDAVLSLVVRRWILDQTGRTDGQELTALTSNQFLALFGNPTEIEAKIGTLYETEGLPAATSWIETTLLPTYQAQKKRQSRQRK
jgi:dsRNA-specific ribonuclease